MPKLDNLEKGLRKVDKIADHAQAIVVVAGLIGTAAKVVEKVIENRKEKIDISAICPKSGHRMTIDEAKDHLREVGVKASYVSIKKSEAKSEYRDCCEFQVVDVKPSTKISPNEKPIVYYITQKVIDKSQQLFEESEQQRMIDKEGKQSKRSERKEKVKQVIIKPFDTAKQEIKKIPAVLHKKNKTD